MDLGGAYETPPLPAELLATDRLLVRGKWLPTVVCLRTHQAAVNSSKAVAAERVLWPKQNEKA